MLVNSADVLGEAPLADMDVETWDRIIAVDLRSVFLCCRWGRRTWSRAQGVADRQHREPARDQGRCGSGALLRGEGRCLIGLTTALSR